MTNKEKLSQQILQKKSMLCVGLDSDVSRMPEGIAKMPEGVLEFNKRIIDSTQDLCVSYKLNTAFYEAMGSAGWECMARTLEYIPSEILTIADAKRGDIGNTATQYRRALLEELDFDAITLNPYMGLDSMQNFLEIPGKWGIALGLTSNAGSADIQQQKLESGKKVYEHTMDLLSDQYSDEQLMYVVGATKLSELAGLRQKHPQYFFLIPGVGAQGASLSMVMNAGYVAGSAGMLINSSRSIIFASSMPDFEQASRAVALDYQKEMEAFIDSQDHKVGLGSS